MSGNNVGKIPPTKHVADEIRVLRDRLAKLGITAGPNDSNNGSHIELRLQVYPSGEWVLRWGDPQYDQDHRGWWGNSFLPGMDASDEQIYTIASNLVDQAADMAAMDNDCASVNYGV